jgi:PAS domain S-box-containing protein
MSKYGNVPIKVKLVIIIMLASIIAVIAGFTTYLLFDMVSVKNEIKKNADLNADLIGEYSVVPLMFDYKDEATNVLSKLNAIPSVLDAYLYNSKGEIFSEYHKDKGKNFVPPDLKNEISEFQHGFIHIFHEINFEGKKTGTLYLRLSSYEVRERLRNNLVVIITILLILLVSVYFIANRLQRFISKPILDLAEIAGKVSKDQNFSVRLRYEGTDEVGVLYKQFNHLLSQISKRQKERDEAEREISLLAQVLKNIGEFVSITDLNDNLIFVNQAWLNVFGYTEEEVIGKNVKIIVSPNNDPEYVAKILPDTINGGWQGEVLNVKKDGTVFPVYVYTTIIYNAENQPIALAGISSDITERKRIENELINHRIHLEDLVDERTNELQVLMNEIKDLYDNSPCGYHSLDENGKYIRINNTELKWLGYTREEVIYKKGTSDFLTPESKKIYEKVFPEFMKTGEINNVIFEYMRKDGSAFYGSLNATSIVDSNGKFLRSRSTLFDITDRKRIETELSEAIKEAENANKAKSEFLANMSHEIRTPMNAVLGYTELLSSLLTDETQKNYIESIKSSGRSLLTLINDILDLSKIEAGKLELEYDYVDSQFFFTEFEKIFALKAKEKGIKFIVEIQSGTPGGIYVDEPRLRQIVFNLVGNAIKFTDQGYVKLKVHTENIQIIEYKENTTEEFLDLIIEVEDTGIGISKEVMEEIFNPFIQARDQKNIGGTGLGLTITRRLTSLMNGTINLKSDLGKGSTFIVRIPEIAFKRLFSGTTISVQINPADVIFEPSTILIVDDVEHNRNFIRDVLSKTSIKVLQADEGFKGLEIARKELPDLIITDIRMPNMDGFEFLDRIKKEKLLKDIPVLAYSASVLKDQKEKIHKSEFVGLLTKPVKIAELYVALMNHLKYGEANAKTATNEPSFETSKSDIIDFAGLMQILNTDYKEIWKGFEVRQPIGEIKKFADCLVDLGNKHNSILITQYGKNLRTAAENFDIEGILSLLKQYVSKIEYLNNQKQV